jgi:hypothetical protein
MKFLKIIFAFIMCFSLFCLPFLFFYSNDHHDNKRNIDQIFKENYTEYMEIVQMVEERNLNVGMHKLNPKLDYLDVRKEINVSRDKDDLFVTICIYQSFQYWEEFIYSKTGKEPEYSKEDFAIKKMRDNWYFLKVDR